MLGRLHLVRHGEVANPAHLCYGDLPGFGLSPLGRRQARSAAAHLAARGADLLLASPLQRAVETAEILARALGLPVALDERLTEWRLGVRWRGVAWESLPSAFPGELEAYLEHPADLPFAPESLAATAERVGDLIEELGRRHPGIAAVLVSHQDPLQAARLLLTGGDPGALHRGKPGHAAVLTLVPGPPWREISHWEPPLPGVRFPPV
ncbi:MAG: histidine phosphatase family protein [Actinobacteria bacterium]|nr:histidine phosphatase family protein [Actinomycetota bacterium]